MRLVVIGPWKNPRSKVYWFRRRVPAKYRRFGMPAEIKFSLGTTDLEEAKILCQEENLKLEREWRAMAGQQPTQLTHLQITALAGEFYKETVAARRDEPGPPAEIERSLREHAKRKRPPIGPLDPHLYVTFGLEARAFLQRKGIHLVGDRLHSFIRSLRRGQRARRAGAPAEREEGLHAQQGGGRTLPGVQAAESREEVRRAVGRVR
ncbi:UNVERIFIED_ORG: hypothetical protein J2R69_004644 [Bradyrhizobium japonicum]